MEKYKEKYPKHKVVYFHEGNPMSTLSPRKQFRLFYRARIHISAHSGHMANLIFTKPGALIVEIGCDLWSWVSMAQMDVQMNFTLIQMRYGSGIVSPCPGPWNHKVANDAHFFADTDLIMQHIATYLKSNK